MIRSEISRKFLHNIEINHLDFEFMILKDPNQ